MIKNLLAGSFILMTGTCAYASIIAVIDSGTDVTHELIAPVKWVNHFDIADNQRDEDKNGYPDDVYGWNFAENNNLIIDLKHQDLLNDDIRKFFEIQTKVVLGTLTEEDIAWIKAIVKNRDFMKKLGTYANFMHGTHVAGITAKENPYSNILTVKMLASSVRKMVEKEISRSGNSKNFILKKLLTFVARQQVGLMEEIAAYVDFHGVDVANGSFGTGFNQAKMIIELIYKKILKKKNPDPEKIKNLAIHFLKELVRNGNMMVDAAPNTLFVFAAGNDGTDNDQLPTFPSNIDRDNVLSVAATTYRKALATFSNHGANKVDVAAPGVAINSSVPGNEYLEVSGTSQAAPYVAKVAGLVKDANKSLRPFDIKKIVMETVDKKAFLKGKVGSSGIVNLKRAVRAGIHSQIMPLGEAVERAKEEIADVKETGNVSIPSTPHELIKNWIPTLPPTLRW